MSFGGKGGTYRQVGRCYYSLFFFGKGRVGLVEGFRYVAYICIWYVTYPLLIFEGMMMNDDICC